MTGSGGLLTCGSHLLQGQQQTSSASPYLKQSRSVVNGSGETSPSPGNKPAPDDPLSKYLLPFGNGPYLPSEAKASFDGFLSPNEIPTASYCAHCHADVHAQWRQSAHANSFRTPWYVKNVNLLAADKGVAATRHCEGCHNPSALFSGALTPGSTVPRPNDEDGVTCMTCHSIQATQKTTGIGSYIMGKPAVLIDDQNRPVPGLPADAEILAHPTWHSRAVMRPLYRTSEFCAACHKAAVPESMNGYKWLRMFSTYDEWQQSSWSTETPLSFYKKEAASSCQSCHMEATTARDPSASNGTVPSHRWLGANTAVAQQYGYSEQMQKLLEFLRNDQLEVDIFGLTVEHAPTAESTVGDDATPAASRATVAAYTPGSLIAPLGEKPFTVLPGDWVRVDVVVRNKGLGHTLIPELRDLYESWLDFQALDGEGRTLYRSGALQPDHSVDPEARSYGLRLISGEARQLDRHEVWKTHIKAYDATISPGRSDVVRYRFRIPPDAKSVQIVASLRYRRFNRLFSDWVFNDPPGSPDRFQAITLAEGRFRFDAGHNLPHPQALPAGLTTLIRWNNYGIGMIDRLQFAEAVDAFHQVIAADTKYEPGYVNIAIAEYSRGRYGDSLHWIAQALAIDPDDARALYYRGLCLRWQNHYPEAIAVLEPVAERYPRFRQVHQELGYMLMVQRKYNEAKTQYEAVLAIDPDDPVAHRWLGPVLAALGDHAGAAQQAKLASATNPDLAAGWLTQRFWRDHLDLASEAMPSHTHSPHDVADDVDVKRVLNLQNPPSYIWVEHY